MKRRFTKTGIIIFGLISVLFLFCWTLLPCLRFYIYYNTNSYQYWTLGRVWPSERISIGCYYCMLLTSPHSGRGVGVGISGNRALEVEFPVEQMDDWDSYRKQELTHPIEKRIHLYIDNELIPDSSKQIYKSGQVLMNFLPDTPSLNASYDISWAPYLSLGKHKAKIVIETLPGEIIEYEWEFTVTLW